jgi:hypothetical protein
MFSPCLCISFYSVTRVAAVYATCSTFQKFSPFCRHNFLQLSHTALGLSFLTKVHSVLLQMETDHPLFRYVLGVLDCFTALFGALLLELHTCKYPVRTVQ